MLDWRYMRLAQLVDYALKQVGLLAKLYKNGRGDVGKSLIGYKNGRMEERNSLSRRERAMRLRGEARRGKNHGGGRKEAKAPVPFHQHILKAVSLYSRDTECECDCKRSAKRGILASIVRAVYNRNIGCCLKRRKRFEK